MTQVMINGISVNELEREAVEYGAMTVENGELVVTRQLNPNWEEHLSNGQDEYFYKEGDKTKKRVKWIPLKMNDLMDKIRARNEAERINRERIKSLAN